MRFQKSMLIVLLSSFVLTGCYTQLEFTQRTKKPGDKKSVEGYSWTGDSKKNADLPEADSIYMAETYGAKQAPVRSEGEQVYEDEEYIPISYKDYEVLEAYEACGCNPYKSYVISDPFYRTSFWNYGFPVSYHSSFYHDYAFWPYYRHGIGFYPYYGGHFGWRHFHSRFRFAFHWGTPYYYDPFYYDPFYSYPFYSFGYSHPFFARNNFFFFGGFTGNVVNRKDSRRYGRRSIGADRVTTTTRTGSEVRSRSKVIRSSSGNNATFGRRTNGTTGVRKSRGTVERTRSTPRTRSRGSGRVESSGRTRSDSGTRSRGTVQRSGRSDINNVRSRSSGASNVRRGQIDKHSSAPVSRTRLRSTNDGGYSPDRGMSRVKIESRIRQQRVKQQKKAAPFRSRSSFFGEFKRVFNTSGIRHNTSWSERNSRTYNHNRPSTSGSHYGRSSRSSSHRSSSTTVTRSRSRSSSSGTTRSRGSSSGGSRSRSR